MPMKIGTARAWGRLRDFFDLKGKHDLQLDEIIVPVALVADLTEADPLADLRQAQGGEDLGAAAGFIGQMQVFNPVGSGIVIEVYSVQASTVASTTWTIGPVTATLAVNGQAIWQDTRLSGIPVGRFQAQALVAGPQIVDGYKVRSLSGAHFFLSPRVTLLPGNGYRVEAGTQNLQIWGGMLWSERDLLPGE